MVVGGGIGGLCVALLLGRQGHSVTVCERDPAPTPASAAEAWADWPRPGTPQARLGHAFLAGFRRQLRERLPDVLDAVLANGAPQLDVTRWMPATERRADDDDLVMVLVRRPVIEVALRRAVEAEPTVQMRAGCQVRGLLAEPASGNGIPRVTGVETSTGAMAADTVVVAGGRAVPVGRWFQGIGAALPDEQAVGCGSACYTRYFRLHDRGGEDEQIATSLTVHRDPGYLVYELWGADNRTFAAELAVPVTDRPMKQLRDTAVWTAAASAMPEWPEWISPERSQPISPAVEVMGQERNTLRRFIEDGRPLALGVHVIGDARCQTDSLFAWGCGNALMAAVALADAVAEHPGDEDGRALALAAAVDAELADRYAYSVARDHARDRVMDGKSRWDTMTTGIGLIDGVLWPAADHDAEVFRAVQRWDMQLDLAAGLEADASISERARAAVGETAEPPIDDEGIPSREQLLAAMAEAAPA